MSNDENDVAYDELPANQSSIQLPLAAPVQPDKSQETAKLNEDQKVAENPEKLASPEPSRDFSQLRVHVMVKGIQLTRGIGTMKEMISREFHKKYGVQPITEEIYLKKNSSASATAYVGFQYDYEAYKVVSNPVTIELPLIDKKGETGVPECEIPTLFKYFLDKNEVTLREQLQKYAHPSGDYKRRPIERRSPQRFARYEQYNRASRTDSYHAPKGSANLSTDSGRKGKEYHEFRRSSHSRSRRDHSHSSRPCSHSRDYGKHRSGSRHDGRSRSRSRSVHRYHSGSRGSPRREQYQRYEENRGNEYHNRNIPSEQTRYSSYNKERSYNKSRSRSHERVPENYRPRERSHEASYSRYESEKPRLIPEREYYPRATESQKRFDEAKDQTNDIYCYFLGIPLEGNDLQIKQELDRRKLPYPKQLSFTKRGILLILL